MDDSLASFLSFLQLHTQGVEKANHTTCKMKPSGQKAWLFV